MHHVFFVIVLSLHVGYSLTHINSDSSQKNGSHNLFKTVKSISPVQRPVRCTPCEDANLKKPISNHLDRDYRGNGADNLGYDWSPMAWGGLAFPQKSKLFTNRMPGMPGMMGRGGRMMTSDWGRNQGNVRMICDTCRTYWEENVDEARGSGTGGNRGRQFDARGGQDFYGGQTGYWQGDRMRLSNDYETRVMSPTVGVLVKPGSKIAYIPSRSGEMYWDGVSGGGTRWDGFSNGISWVGANAPDWDRSDSDRRDEKPGYGDVSVGSGGGYPYGSSSFGSWNDLQKPSNWADGRGRGHYYSNGIPNFDPQWSDRGYASKWHYGSTNQNGWNGNNMKWNYGGKQWADNDRAANQFYFNSPRDKYYRPTKGSHQQYGIQYPNYQSAGGHPSSFRPQALWPSSGGYRPNDRFPSSFQPGNPESGDSDKPWDYSSRDPSGYRRPGSQPEWIRPGPHYPVPVNFQGNPGKFPSTNEGYDKFSSSDRNDFEKPWNRPSAYGPSKPTSGGIFPSGGNRYPEEGGSRPGFPVGGGHLFIPNSSTESGGIHLNYPSRNGKPGEYPGSKLGPYQEDSGRPYPADRLPSVIYTGGRPSKGGNPVGGYPDSGSTSGYPSTGSSVSISSGYPIGNRPGQGYSNPLSGYPDSENPYSSGISRPAGYPSIGSYPENVKPGSYPGSGSQPDKYGGGDSSAAYPSGGSLSYPGGSIRPSLYSDEGYHQPGYFGGSRPTGYPGTGRPGGYPGNAGSRPNYPISGPSPNTELGSGGSSEIYQQGGKHPPKGYYTGFITELSPDDQSQYGGRYPNYFGGNYPVNIYPGKDRDREKYFYVESPNRRPSGEKNGYPAFSEDRYSNGGGGYSIRDKNTGYDRGSEKFYYGQTSGKGKYPEEYPSNHRYPNGGRGGDFDRNQGSGSDKNSWNYGQNERKDGIYRRSGGSYPPYRGGQYYTSSYLASMSTTSGSTEAGTEPKTQTMTKADEVTQSTLDSS